MDRFSRTRREDFPFRHRAACLVGLGRTSEFLPYLHGPIFDEIRSDPSKFRELAVDRELGTVVWPNGADIDPDVLFKGLRPAWSEVDAPA